MCRYMYMYVYTLSIYIHSLYTANISSSSLHFDLVYDILSIYRYTANLY